VIVVGTGGCSAQPRARVPNGNVWMWKNNLVFGADRPGLTASGGGGDRGGCPPVKKKQPMA